MKQWSTLKKLIWMRFVSAVREYSGAIVTFFTSVEKPLKNLIIHLQPIQSGSGTPSPDNVRPISGRTEANAYVSPTQDEADATVYNVTFDVAGTVYGGTVDVVSGVLTVIGKMVTLDGTENWSVSGTSKFYCPIGGAEFQNSTSIDEQISNMYIFSGLGGGGSAAVTVDHSFYLQRVASNVSWCRAWVYDTDYTFEDFKAMLNNTPLQVTYPIVPTTYQLDPQTVQTLVGQNVVWSDAGDVTVRV